jgi:hypothetical protein
MTAPLDYITAVADQASERSLPGSVTVELARLTREVVAELRAAREVVKAVRRWPPLVCVDCYETGCDGEDEPCNCEDGCHAKDQAFRDALTAYDQVVSP